MDHDDVKYVNKTVQQFVALGPDKWDPGTQLDRAVATAIGFKELRQTRGGVYWFDTGEEEIGVGESALIGLWSPSRNVGHAMEIVRRTTNSTKSPGSFTCLAQDVRLSSVTKEGESGLTGQVSIAVSEALQNMPSVSR